MIKKIFHIVGRVLVILLFFFCLFCICCLDSENWIPFFLGFAISATALGLYGFFEWNGGLPWDEE